ncbi:MAG: hypothetical protein EOS61_16110 [Mesorhizobium sp.]|nr:MAG: hypothetical protein EOQ57_28360 [Mesorhizobium sp.]RWE10919.1 MAG: hypothetical protein EOS61_16110 [Mesorhizobium sp.]TIS45495.1 MAG: hypothetical protein E5W96_31365 [Mesorhizobium sp.]
MITKDSGRQARRVWSMPTGEKLAAALVLNRPDWLAEMNYMLAEAIERVGPEWLSPIPEAARGAGIRRARGR